MQCEHIYSVAIIRVVRLVQRVKIKNYTINGSDSQLFMSDHQTNTSTETDQIVNPLESMF